MTTFHDVPADLLNPAVAAKLADNGAITAPEWADFVKTGTHRERPPEQENWWQLRAAALLRKVGKLGPIGVNHLSQEYGGGKDRGARPQRAVAGSRHIIRTILQQLEDGGLVEVRKTPGGVILGRVLTGAGQSLLDNTAHETRGAAEETYPGLSKY